MENKFEVKVKQHFQHVFTPIESPDTVVPAYIGSVLHMSEEDQAKLTNTWEEQYNYAFVDKKDAAINQIKANIENGSILAMYCHKHGQVYYKDTKESLNELLEEMLEYPYVRFLAVIIAGGVYVSFKNAVTDEKGYRGTAVLTTDGYYDYGIYCRQGEIYWGACIGPNTTLQFGVEIGASVIGKECRLDPDVFIQPTVTIGDSTDIGRATKVCLGANIGSFCVIAAGSTIGSHVRIADYTAFGTMAIPDFAFVPKFMHNWEFTDSDLFFIPVACNGGTVRLPVVLHEGEHYIAINMTGYMKISQFFAELTYNPGKYAELITQLPTIVEAIGKLPR